MLKINNKNTIMYLIALSFALFNTFLQTIPISLSSHFEKILGLYSSDVIGLYSFYFVAYLVLQIPIGYLFEKYGLRKVFIYSLLLTFLGYALHVFSHVAYLLSISRFISGVGGAASYLSAVYIAMNFFDRRILPLLVAFLQIASTLGSLLAITPLHWAISHFSWLEVNSIILIFIMFQIMLALFYVQDKKYNFDLNHDVEKMNVFEQIIRVFKNKDLCLIFTYSFFTRFIILSFAGFWIKEYMMSLHNYSEGTSLKLADIYWIGYLIASVAIGLYSRNYQQHKRILLGLALLGSLLYVLMVIPIVFNLYLIIAICALGGISTGGVVLSFSLLPHLVRPQILSVATSLNNIFLIIGGLCGQYLFGVVLNFIKNKHIHSNNLVFNNPYYISLWLYIVSAVIATGAIVILYCRRR